MKTSIPLMKLGLASAIAVAAFGMTGCGGDDDSKSVVDFNADGTIVDRFACTDSSAAGSRVICIGAADDLTDTTISDELVTALSTAQTGDTIVLPQGRFNIATELTFDGNGSLGQDTMVTGLTIQGAGMDKTILDFDAAAGEASAKADGFFISNTNDIILEDFGVYEAPNNAIKIKKADGIIMRRLATVWETDYQSTNGAYGLYPVETQNVLIEDCFVKGSADAGVYVGQSSNIVVRNNIAEKNVAGIEIENSMNADVYGNTASGNTGGILIFDLPIGNGLYGSGVRIFDNKVIENNAANFATVGDFAGGVHIVPPGTGMIVLSTSDVEIFDNTITDHKTTSIAITSYAMPDEAVLAAPSATPDIGGAVSAYEDIVPYASVYLDGWSPLVRSINMHDNIINNTDLIYAPEGSLIEDIILGYTYNGIKVPTILYDGVGEAMAQNGSFGLIAGGINATAQALYDNVLNPMGDDSGAKQIPNMTEFGAYADTDYVCSSNNGDNNQTAVIPTDSLTGDPVFLENDDSMVCGGETDRVPYIGAAATVTVAGVAYGCGADDKTSKHCVPAAE
jgi:parallel beta-helix repeat protein